MTMRPDLKIKAVVLGSRILIMTAAKRLGLNSALRHFIAIVLKSRPSTPKLAVETMFYNSGVGFSTND